MMKSFKSFIAVALLAIGVTASAQTVEFNPHWFLNLQGGAQYTLGEAPFGDLISPNAQLGLGYQFSPVFGARLAVNGWQSKGGFNEGQTDIYKWNYVSPTADFMFNLSNLFGGYRYDRFFNVTAFLGGGANYGFGNDEANTMAANGTEFRYLWDGSKIRGVGRGGLLFDFRLSDVVSIILEGNANILSDHYNSKQADNPDWYFNALAGLKFNLGKTYTKVPAVVVPATTPAAAAAATKEPEPPVVNPEPKEPEPVVVPVFEPVSRNILFLINKWDIRPSEQPKIDEIVEVMNKYPETKIRLSGYADKDTGTASRNQFLSQKRVEVVAKALEDAGISPDRISTEYFGSTVNPFSTPEANRVTVCLVK